MTAKRMGRPRKNPEDLGRRPNLSLRVRQALYDQIKAAAEASGRSMSEEMEVRVEAAFAQRDLRYVIREELANAAQRSLVFSGPFNVRVVETSRFEGAEPPRYKGNT